ncbi:porin (plasmid) [Rhizobium leguminosarum]|nr:porin [Rhizobium leguminosarum]MBY5475379.1 porin [Rhizobium leguminosarum]MBY5496637.1 porin [Rhizobium leguminosarum]NKJ96588.1 porin [Rhizobium leguminosarum bv. viciae]NKK03463.1 porin [Rhizobium leguminosarum bv. viciae]NKK86201.1 porin [Rhizobium leguminosarum bv. viciae]
MNIRTVLFASVAALAAASGARAADAIVAAEPEPVEYVRVCDAYGTGYFYIPGTETCLSISGYIRTEVRFGDHISGDSDVDFWTRGQVTFQAKNDTEYGTLTGVITLRYNVDNASDQEALLDEGYIDIAGFRVGKLYSWWDDDMSGETDTLASNETTHNSIRYQYENGAFAAGISVDELEEDYATKPGEGPNNFGVAGQVSYKAGAISAYLLAGYDTDTSEVAVRGIVYADIGPGTLGIAGVWASGANYYYEESEWTIAAEYALKINDKWKITPGFQYFENIALEADGNGFTGGSAYTTGVTIDYQIVEDLRTKLSVQYHDEDEGDDEVFGFLRFQRDF